MPDTVVLSPSCTERMQPLQRMSSTTLSSGMLGAPGPRQSFLCEKAERHPCFISRSLEQGAVFAVLTCLSRRCRGHIMRIGWGKAVSKPAPALTLASIQVDLTLHVGLS